LTEEQQELVTNVDVLEAAEAKIAELEEEAAKELKVESVSAINKNGVTVTFEALEEALEGVTVTVINPENEEVEVEAQDLEEGATSATFAFVKALEEDPTTGVWTVNGVEYDFDERAAVAKVREATNLVELWEALQSDYFIGAVEENIEAYNAADKSELVTAEDVNKMIADVNASLVDAETIIQPIVDAIKANNELQLLRALQNDAFTDVYSELIVKYKEKLDAEDFFANADIAKIQKTIFEANVSADKEALTLGDVSEVTEDLELPAKGKYGTTITWKAAENQEYLTDEGKVTRPSAVDNDATVTLTATIAIGEDEARVTETKQITVTIKALDKAKSIYAFEYDLPENLVAEEEAVVGVTFKAVENLGEGYDAVRFAFIAEGPEGSTVTFKATDTNETEHTFENEGYWGPEAGFAVGADYDVDTDWELTFSEAGEYTITFSLIDATSETEEVVNGITETVTVTVDKAYVVRVNEATTAEEMRTALTALALAENVSDYINLSSQGKLEVAELVLADRADEEDEEFATKQDAINALDSSKGGAIKARADFIEGVNTADSINTMKTALDKAQLPEFQALGALEKVEVAELVYNALNAFEAGEQFETIAEIKAAAGL
jgi:hypothetical protein